MKTQIIRRTILVVAITLFGVVNNNGSTMKTARSSINITAQAAQQATNQGHESHNTNDKNSLYFDANKREDDEMNEANFFHMETTEEDAKNLVHWKKIMEAVYCVAYGMSYVSYIILLFSL